MSEDKDKIKITVEVNDEPAFLCDISEETLLNMRKAEAAQRAPFVRLANYVLGSSEPDRLLLKITDSLKQHVEGGDRFVAICLRTGAVQRAQTNSDMADKYVNIQDLTPKE